MRSWRALGERAMALRHYDRMCEWLKSDISADPDSASQALARSIRSEQRQFDGVCAPAPPRSSGYGRPLDSRASRRALALIGGMATIALFASGWAFLDYQANVRRDEPAIVFETRSSGRRLFFRVRAGRAPEVFKLRYPARFTRYWSDAAQLLATEVRDSAGNRDVVLIDTDGDSTYVTRHPATDEFSWWAPDGKRFLFSSFRNGTADLFLSSLDGRKITPMSPGAAEDDRGCWSPRGDLIGFRTTRGGMREQWVMDADGKRPRRVLPAADPGACSFSPDGEHMAFTAMGDRRSLYVWHARTDKVEKLLDNAYGASWSPDGLWLAVQAAGESGTDIYRVRGDGYVVENMSRDSAEDRLMGWDGEHRPHYIDEVRINATKPLQLAVAERRKLKARAADPHGNYFGYDAFRWESLDPAVASLLPDGTVVGVKPGRARIVASAGGWRADTISAEVFESAPQVLLEEHFEAGLTRNWIIFGDPRPRVVAGGGVGGTAGFVSSGDDFFESGLISKQQFQLDAGLTVELSARGPERWRLHDLLAIDLISFSADTSGIGAGRLLDLARRTVATLWWIGGYGDRPQLRFGGTRPIDPTGGLPEWHRIALQVRPDGYQELYIDEHLVATSAPSERGIEEVGAAQLVIGYRSRSDLPAQDELIVYRGLKYSSSRQ